MVCRKMDELARLSPYLGIFGLGEKLVLGTWRDPLAKSWIVLYSLVQEERDKTPGWSKWHAFEKLGKKAMDSLNLKEIPKAQLVSLTTENEEANRVAGGFFSPSPHTTLHAGPHRAVHRAYRAVAG